MKPEDFAKLAPGAAVYWYGHDEDYDIRHGTLISLEITDRGGRMFPEITHPSARVQHAERGELQIPIHHLHDATELDSLPTPRELVEDLAVEAQQFFTSLAAAMIDDYHSRHARSPNTHDRMDIMRASVLEAIEFASALDRKFSPKMTANLRALGALK